MDSRQVITGVAAFSPGDLLNQPLMPPALAGGFFTTGATWEDKWTFSRGTTIYPGLSGLGC